MILGNGVHLDIILPSREPSKVGRMSTSFFHLLSAKGDAKQEPVRASVGMITLSETNQKGIRDPCQCSSNHPGCLVPSASLPLRFLECQLSVDGHLLGRVAALELEVAALELVVVAKLVVSVPVPPLQRLGTMLL